MKQEESSPENPYDLSLDEIYTTFYSGNESSEVQDVWDEKVKSDE